MIPTLKTLTISGLVLVAAQVACPYMLPKASAAAQENSEGLQELLHREALFHSHQSNHLEAINHLEAAQAQGLLSAQSNETRLLLAQIKLAYGMHQKASFEFHAVLGEDVPAPQRNRAWYELARSFFYKGYNDAAAETLTYIRGDIPADIVGDHQLLRASVLMSLEKNREAAQELEQWRGARELSAYASYNRGIALMRAGERALARAALVSAVELPANGKELLALRDKARLSLGYLYAEDEDFKRARAQLKAVQSGSPFSSQALLGLGWMDYQEGLGESALTSWIELRGRSASDPAVLETLLVIPALHRELHSTQTATEDYRQAIETYANELQLLQSAKNSIATGSAVSALLQQERGAELNDAAQTESAKRFLGSLMANRSFGEVVRGHDELLSMLEMVDRGLQKVHPISESAGNEKLPPIEPESPPIPSNTIPEQATTRQEQNHQQKSTAQGRWIRGEKNGSGTTKREIPQLPEIEQPARRQLKPLPEKKPPQRVNPSFFKLPAVSNYIKQPPNPEIFGMPDSEILWLPHSGEFRRPGQEIEEDYAYPDSSEPQKIQAGENYRYQLTRVLSEAEQESHFDPGAVPVGQALRELAATLNHTTENMTKLNETFDHFPDKNAQQERINKLHTRILKLRMRIANALKLYENYVATMALDELDRRQHLLEDLLEQASLELAKTYDQRSDQ